MSLSIRSFFNASRPDYVLDNQYNDVTANQSSGTSTGKTTGAGSTNAAWDKVEQNYFQQQKTLLSCHNADEQKQLEDARSAVAAMQPGETVTIGANDFTMGDDGTISLNGSPLAINGDTSNPANGSYAQTVAMQSASDVIQEGHNDRAMDLANGHEPEQGEYDVDIKSGKSSNEQ